VNILLYSWWDGEVPFYIGVGKPGRETEWRKRNPHCYAKRKSAESQGTFKILVEVTGLTWEQAWDLERKRISEIGMICNGTGTLTNYAEGGNGGNTHLGWTPEKRQEFSKKMSIVNSSRPASSYGHTKGTIWITDGNRQTRHNPDHPIPPGWQKGRLPHEGSFQKDHYWITNGKMNVLVPINNPIPHNSGWYLGMTQINKKK